MDPWKQRRWMMEPDLDTRGILFKKFISCQNCHNFHRMQIFANMFVIFRILEGHGFLYIANFDSMSNMTINASQEFENIPDRATVYVTSINYEPETAVGYLFYIKN